MRLNRVVESEQIVAAGSSLDMTNIFAKGHGNSIGIEVQVEAVCHVQKAKCICTSVK